MKVRDTVASSPEGECDAVQVKKGCEIKGVEEVELMDAYNRWLVWYLLDANGKRVNELPQHSWVVTRPDGVREFVSDEQFRARYVPQDDGAPV